MTDTAFHIIPYTRAYRPMLNDMLFFSDLMHLHLDWAHIDTWVSSSEALMRVAVQGDRVLGYMGASTPISETTWIRVAVFRDNHILLPVMRGLLENLMPELIALGTKHLLWMMFDDWLASPLALLGFTYVDEVVTFIRYDAPLLPVPSRFGLRTANMNDVKALYDIDSQAFRPMWQMTLEEMRLARRAAATCTVALDGEQMVGFQLSTSHHHNGHLARLAVLPSMQGQGVGSFLVNDMIRYFLRRHVDYVSVNTQLSNKASQHLYRKLGFERSGYDIPVWGIKI